MLLFPGKVYKPVNIAKKERKMSKLGFGPVKLFESDQINMQNHQSASICEEVGVCCVVVALLAL